MSQISWKSELVGFMPVLLLCGITVNLTACIAESFRGKRNKGEVVLCAVFN